MSMSGKNSSALAGVLAGLGDVIVTLIAVAAAQNSAVLLADALKTILEFVAILISWYTLRKISKGAGHNFEYGIGKLENLSSLFVAFLMTCCILLILFNAVRNIMHPSHIAGIGIWISMISQLVYGGINFSFYRKNSSLAKSESSPMLESQAKLFMTRLIGNVFIFISVLISYSLSAYSWVAYVDPVASLIIASTLLLSALGIFSNSLFDLLDRTLEESAQIIILRALAKHFEDYKNMHGMRSRRSGNKVFVEIFLEFDEDKKISDVQTVINSIRAHIEENINNCNVTIGLTTQKEC